MSNEAERLRAFIREVRPGGCKMLTSGDDCKCLLCDVDTLVAQARVSRTRASQQTAPAQPAKWTPEEIERGYVGLRWVTKDGILGRPTEDDLQEALRTLPPGLKNAAAQPASPAPAPTQEAQRPRKADMSTPPLLPLPEPYKTIRLRNDPDYPLDEGLFDAAQMRSYAQECVRVAVLAEREACALICDAGTTGTHRLYADACDACAMLIRARGAT